MLAATRLIALHKNKGKSVAACLKSRTDYAKNPDKTNRGALVSSYQCSHLTADEEFMLSKRQYELMTGRRQKSDVIAYQVRQSFKPGEVTPEEANRIGYEFAERFLKGKHAFIVATHTDRAHIHNHIIYNSTALDGTRKFKNFWLSSFAVQRLSDLICLEHQLSTIEYKPYRERQKRIVYPPKESNRDRLCSVIDSILAEKPKDYEDFLQRLEQQGYEVKRGKHTAVKGARQKRFIRFRTLGIGYGEDEIKAVLEGKVEQLVLVNCCDSMRRVYDIVESTGKCKFLYMLDMPHEDNDCEKVKLAQGIHRLKKAYEKFSGKTFDRSGFLNAFSHEPVDNQPYIGVLGVRVSGILEKMIRDNIRMDVENLTCTGGRRLAVIR